MISAERVDQIRNLAKEFVEPYRSEPWWNGYKFVDLKAYDPDAAEDFCIVIRVRESWQAPVNIPPDYKGVRIFTEKSCCQKR